jgi:hypothetical protein
MKGLIRRFRGRRRKAVSRQGQSVGRRKKPAKQRRPVAPLFAGDSEALIT